MPGTVEFGQRLEADGYLDGLELSAGSSLLNPMYLFRGSVPLKEFAANMPAFVRFGLKTPMGKGFFKAYPFEEAFLREKALAFRAGVTMPLIMLGGINDKATMDRAMAEGFEFVAMGRALLREPDLVNRMQAGQTDHGICIHCNQCMPTIYTGTRCTVREPAPSA
jgi:2,4-dienoyl-CoA reductase-like NADH-dependent reductase (Old Yellow Enzyme family)